MHDKFVADIGDFGKYGLLRTLAGIEPKDEPRCRLGVAAVPNASCEPSESNRHTPRPRWQTCCGSEVIPSRAQQPDDRRRM